MTLSLDSMANKFSDKFEPNQLNLDEIIPVKQEFEMKSGT